MRLFARKEPTNDNHTLASNKKDVVFYRDQKATRQAARIPWYMSAPDKRYRHMILNCAEYRLEWLNDLEVMI